MSPNPPRSRVPVIVEGLRCVYCGHARLTPIRLTDGTLFHACLYCNRLNFPAQPKPVPIIYY